MSNDHKTPAVREDVRATVVVASAPASPIQIARANAAATVVPFAYSSGPKFGGP